MKLTDRLAAAVSLIPQGAVIADIGTDHAYMHELGGRQRPHQRL